MRVSKKGKVEAFMNRDGRAGLGCCVVVFTFPSLWLGLFEASGADTAGSPSPSLS